MKKILASLLALCLSLGILAGCGSSNTPAQSGGKKTFVFGDTTFNAEKHLTQTAACVTTEPFAGAKLTGYEIHAGRTEVRGSAFCILADGTPEGCVQDGVFGTYLHGLFDTGELTEKLTAFLCKRKGIDPAGAELIPMEQYRQQQFDLLADGVRAALDMPAIYAAMGMQKGDNT